MYCWSFRCIFQPKDKEQEFIVGDNSSLTGVYGNLPLKPGRLYQVTLVAVNRQDNDYRYSIVKLQSPIQTVSEANVEEGSGSGAVWAALLLLLLIPAVVYFIWRSVVWITFVTAYGGWSGSRHIHLLAWSVCYFFHYHSHDVSETCPFLSVERYIACTP